MHIALFKIEIFQAVDFVEFERNCVCTNSNELKVQAESTNFPIEYAEQYFWDVIKRDRCTVIWS